MKRILLVDNYDSFTFNLLHSLEKNEGVNVEVIRNNCLYDIAIENYTGIVLSPGPGLPNEAGDLLPFIEKSYKIKPILGICLGHQAIAQFFGAALKNLPQVLHGVQLSTELLELGTLFTSLSSPIATGHYHSWVIDQATLPACLTITARNPDGGVMAIRHTDYNIQGIQFHPESVLTPFGDVIIKNWIDSLV